MSTAQAMTKPCTLILLHGATGNARMWDAVRRSLDSSRFNVIAPDLPGHGTRRGEPFTLEGAVATAIEAARSVAPSPVMLVGDSLGGYTAMAAAHALPQEQLKGLVLGGCSTNVIGTAAVPFLIRAALFKVLIGLFGEPRLIRQNIPVLVRMGMSEPDVRAIVDAGMHLGMFEKVIHALRGVDFRTMLVHIEQPVLIINGSRDKPMLKQEASFVAAGRRVSSLRIENCEHGVSMLRGAEFACVVNDFASRAFANGER